MGKYLKKFETTAEYETFIASDYDKPNVSLTNDNNVVYYNPWVETRLVTVFDVTNTSNPTSIGYRQYISAFTEIEIDGVVQSSVVSAYTFDTIGEHTVKYTLADPTTIGVSAFQNCPNLVSVTIPNNVTNIDGYAFEECSSLASLNIPSSITNIEFGAFEMCVGLNSIIVDKDNTTYDSRNNCNAIIETESNTLIVGCSNTIIPNSVISIGNEAFFNISNLTAINIPNSVTDIGEMAFFGCHGLTSVIVPNSVTDIGEMAFSECTSLTSITIGNSVTSIGNYAFQECSNITSIIIPNSVITIGECTFESCESLTSITIGNSVTNIKKNAFRYCSALNYITCNATTAPIINKQTFNSIKSNGTLTVPIGSSGYDVWMQEENYYLGRYNWTKVEQ